MENNWNLRNFQQSIDKAINAQGSMKYFELKSCAERVNPVCRHENVYKMLKIAFEIWIYYDPLPCPPHGSYNLKGLE